jgi:16S rRNA G1207 methylase RsmC
MILVCKREAWYRNKLQAIFGNVRASHDDNYIVLQATKKLDTVRTNEELIDWH